MASLSSDLIFLILQFLQEEKYREAVHKLEQESGVFFNMKYFEELLCNGAWDGAEKYLSGFTKLDENRYSVKIFFEMRKQKYLEALDRKDKSAAIDILINDLRIFSSFNEDLFKEMTQLLTFENFRQNEQLSKYRDAKTARTMLACELRKLVESNPLLREKLQVPVLKQSRLRNLVNQSLNWQHSLCKNPRQNPEIVTLLYDHSCSQQVQPNGALAASPAATVMNVVQKTGGYPQMAPQGPFLGTAPIAASLASWMANPTAIAHPAVSGSPLALPSSSNPAAASKRPWTPPTSNPLVDYHLANSENMMKRPRPLGMSDEARLPNTHLPVGYPNAAHAAQNCFAAHELPRNIVMALHQGSSVTSMDFHPVKLSFLLVGTNVGDTTIWELVSRQRLAHRSFKVWDIQACTAALQAALIKDPAVSANRVAWSCDGNQFGVAYSKHIVHLYGFNGNDDLTHHLEIDAHVGAVNDLVFSTAQNQPCIVTCGDDRTIKVWAAASGQVLFTFEGHEAPVYCICPHAKENIQFLFSTSIDGKIKAWLYDNEGSRVDYDAPGRCCTTMAYSSDGTRLFSCGTSKDGETYIVEWNESEGSIRRTYSGFRKGSLGVVQFDTTKNRYLAAGDEFMVKFWDMDNTNILTMTDADGGLPASPRIRFNKNGSLLAVSTSENCIKILANANGLQLLLRSHNITQSTSEATTTNPLGTVNSMAGTSSAVVDRSASVVASVGLTGDGRHLGDIKPAVIHETLENYRTRKLLEINEPSQCHSLRLPDNLFASKVSRLIYTNSGLSILALASNAVHKLWKWQKNDRNVTGKATTLAPPHLWQPSSGIMMTNQVVTENPEEAVHCFALSKNDSYVISASGGKISLFTTMTFKTMTTFMDSPPAATFLAFHPQDNNIVAVGMADSSIRIYNVRTDEVISKLTGHHKRVTGLAFSNTLNVLVSSGADALLCVWRMHSWEKQTTKGLQIPPGRVSSSIADTQLQFHHDQTHLLVVHETQLDIFETARLALVKQWMSQEVAITSATYSCDSQMIYASFRDGSVSIFAASTLQLRCRIHPTAYLPNTLSGNVYPLVVAANPLDPNQFALGLSDGGVLVLEPLESEETWGALSPSENGNGADASAAQAAGNAASDPKPRGD